MLTVKLLCLYYSVVGGAWSQDGCHVLFSDDKKTVCQCDHLTNFAVLMDVTGTKVFSKPLKSTGQMFCSTITSFS